MSNIFVAGHNGMVGAAITRKLKNETGHNLITRSRAELDLTNQADVRQFFKNNAIDQVYLAAAKVGGIHANNTYPASFIYENMMIQNNIVDAAHQSDVQHLLFLGSSCIYPKENAQPITEASLLTGKLEPTNEPYAIAKIAGIKMCESYNRQYGRDYRSVMPTNLYGPGDNFHPENSHVIPALIRRFHEATRNQSEVVTIWGSGKPKREFLHVDDMADASIHVMNLDKEKYDSVVTPMQSHINVGTGTDVSIGELASLIADVTEFQGQLAFDTTKPDGTMRKLLDITTLQNAGWSPTIELKSGLNETYKWYLESQGELRGFD